MGLLIYLIGCFASYIMGRYTSRYWFKNIFKYPEDYGWGSVLLVIAISLTSYVGFLIFVIIHTSDIMVFKNIKFKFPKVPKWL